MYRASGSPFSSPGGSASHNDENHSKISAASMQAGSKQNITSPWDLTGNPAHTPVGNLIVLNDDKIGSHREFGLHHHENVEIVSYFAKAR
jgi:hypothetical protein